MERRGIHYFNMAKISFTRAAWILSLPNTIGILFLIWANSFFQDHYAGLFFYNFWVFLVILVVPFLAYMVFEYTKVWSGEIDIANQKSWGAAHNPMRELLLETSRDVKELKALVTRLQGAPVGAGAGSSSSFSEVGDIEPGAADKQNLERTKEYMVKTARSLKELEEKAMIREKEYRQRLDALEEREKRAIRK